MPYPGKHYEIPNLVGTWFTDPYITAFPETSDLYPTDGDKKFETKIVINRQDNNLLWFTNYWKAVDDEEWLVEKGTGVINTETTTVSLIESSPPLECPCPPKPYPYPYPYPYNPYGQPKPGVVSSTGVFTLTPYQNNSKYTSCFNNDYYLTYKGIARGISFSSILRYQGQSIEAIEPLVNE